MAETYEQKVYKRAFLWDFNMKTEKDPSGLTQHEPGAKLDHGKPRIRTHFLEYFPHAIIALTRVSEYGAEKYTRFGWAKVKDGPDRYGNAEIRHILDAIMQKPLTEDEVDLMSRIQDVNGYSFPELMHATQEAWNAIAKLELMLTEVDPDALY